VTASRNDLGTWRHIPVTAPLPPGGRKGAGTSWCKWRRLLAAWVTAMTFARLELWKGSLASILLGMIEEKKPANMRSIIATLSLLLVLAPSALQSGEHPTAPLARMNEEKRPDDPSDQYFEAWLRYKDAEKLKETKPEEALERYSTALGLFKGIQARWPEWKKDMVKNRIAVTEEVLKSLEKGKGK